MLLVNLHLHQIALQHLHLQSLKNIYTKCIHQKPNRVQLCTIGHPSAISALTKSRGGLITGINKLSEWKWKLSFVFLFPASYLDCGWQKPGWIQCWLLLLYVQTTVNKSTVPAANLSLEASCVLIWRVKTWGTCVLICLHTVLFIFERDETHRGRWQDPGVCSVLLWLWIYASISWAEEQLFAEFTYPYPTAQCFVYTNSHLSRAWLISA